VLPAGETCDIPEDVDCDSFWTLAEAILDIAHQAVVDGQTEQCEIEKFVSVAEPVYGTAANYVSVWLQSVTWAPAPTSTSKLIMPRPRAQFGIKAMETGWPIAETTGGPVALPDPARMHALAKHSMSHMEMMVRRVNNALRAHTFESEHGAVWQSMGAVNHTPRSGGAVGWIFSVTLEAQWTPFRRPGAA
jgi:hypothetical protein